MTTETPDKVNKKLISLKLQPKLIERLKERAITDRSTMTTLLEEGAEMRLAQAKAPVVIPDRRTAPERREEPERQVPGRRAAEPEARLCTRCGHKRFSHWARGCMPGCACSERLYRERTA